jgi:hypothetical protein
MGKGKRNNNSTKSNKNHQQRIIQNQDALLRMNFLLQAATLYAATPLPSNQSWSSTTSFVSLSSDQQSMYLSDKQLTSPRDIDGQLHNNDSTIITAGNAEQTSTAKAASQSSTARNSRELKRKLSRAGHSLIVNRGSTMTGISRFYSQSMKNVAARLVIRMQVYRYLSIKPPAFLTFSTFDGAGTQVLNALYVNDVMQS